METFVKEAIVRAAYERRQVAGGGGGVGEFLEVRIQVVGSGRDGKGMK